MDLTQRVPAGSRSALVLRILMSLLMTCGAAVAAVAVVALGAAPAAAKVVGASSPGATSVLAFGADKRGVADSTAAFLSAEDAALASTVRFASGPSGDPQAIVYVPPGTYRLLRLNFRSNVRMEVSSGAVLEQAGGRYVPGQAGPPALIQWNGPGGSPVTNVSLVGVADSSAGPKASAKPVFPGWTVAGDFTFNLDPAATNASVLVAGLAIYNAQYFLVQNVFSIQNDFQPTTTPTTDDGYWPQSRKAALMLNERSDTPIDGSVFYDPHDGTIENWYNINSPKGFGPNQVNAGHDLTFHHIFSDGGTTLRFETDASMGKSFAAELRGVNASDIAGENCNRAVSFAPHSQNNYDVHVTGVQAVGCAQGVVESIDETHQQSPGSFVNSTISDVHVTAGSAAQLGNAGGTWTVGTSSQAFAKDKPLQVSWSVMYGAGTYSCNGGFASASNPILTTAGVQRPVCT